MLRSVALCMLRSVAFDCLTAAFKGENEDYYHNTAAWVDLDESCLLGEPCTLHSFDLYTVKTAEIKELQALRWYCGSPWCPVVVLPRTTGVPMALDSIGVPC